MTVGFLLAGHDNNSFMLGEDSRKAMTLEEGEFYHWRFTLNGGLHPAICQKCGRKTDQSFFNPKFNLCKKRMDISSTYDGYTIVSERFRQFCISQKLNSLEFVKLPSQPGHYWLRVHNVLVIDREKSTEIQFRHHCDLCNSYAGVHWTSWPAKICFQDVESAILTGIYRSDMEFADSHEQSYLTIVSFDLVTAIKAQKFKGISLTKIEC
ncbi:MAG: hypothetical protein V1791_00645 [Pseudomonadota bacterium]